MDAREALSREDVPELTKTMIRAALAEGGWSGVPLTGRYQPSSVFCAGKE